MIRTAIVIAALGWTGPSAVEAQNPRPAAPSVRAADRQAPALSNTLRRRQSSPSDSPPAERLPPGSADPLAQYERADRKSVV